MVVYQTKSPFSLIFLYSISPQTLGRKTDLTEKKRSTTRRDEVVNPGIAQTNPINASSPTDGLPSSRKSPKYLNPPPYHLAQKNKHCIQYITSCSLPKVCIGTEPSKRLNRRKVARPDFDQRRSVWFCFSGGLDLALHFIFHADRCGRSLDLFVDLCGCSHREVGLLFSTSTAEFSEQ